MTCLDDLDNLDGLVGIARILQRCARWLEQLLALCIFVGVMVFTLHSIWKFTSLNWGQTETFYELISRVLVAIIALELIRTLVTHKLQSVLEMLGFVVARKCLKPNLSVFDIFLIVVAFAILLACRRFLFTPTPTQGTDDASADRSSFSG